MTISTPKTSSFFGAISKSLRFEDDTSKQNDNENQAGQSSADEKLDDQLNDLKEDQDNSKGESDDADSNNDDSDPGNPGDQEDDFGDLGLGGEEDGGGDDSSDSNSGSSGIGSSPDDNQPKSIGSAPRKLTLYAEFNRIHNVLKESIAAIQKRATENSSIKNCVKLICLHLFLYRKSAESRLKFRSRRTIRLTRPSRLHVNHSAVRALTL